MDNSLPHVGISLNGKIYIKKDRSKIYLTKYVAIKLLCQLLVILWFCNILPNNILNILKYTIRKYPMMKMKFTCKLYANSYVKLKNMLLNMDSVLLITQKLVYILSTEYDIYSAKQVAFISNPICPKYRTNSHDWTDFFTKRHLCSLFNNEHLFIDIIGSDNNV